MTLLLGCITHDYAVQVSDRRLTWSDGRLAEDQQNKAVVIDGGIAVSYTGLAEIEGKKTDEWLVDVIGESLSDDFGSTATALCDRATRAFAKLRLPSALKRHAFLLSGWVVPRDDPGPRAFFANISNFVDDKWRSQAESRASFSISKAYGLPRSKDFMLASLGQGLPPAVGEAARRGIRECVRHRTGPGALVEVLARGVWDVASSNPAVGPNLMAVSIPRGATGGGLHMPLGRTFPKDSVVGVDLPGIGGEAILYAPNFVSRQMRVRSVWVKSDPQ